MKRDFRGAFELFSSDIEAYMKQMREEANANRKVVLDAIEGLKKAKLKEESETKRESTNNSNKASTKQTGTKNPMKPEVPPKPKTKYQAKTKILYVADSIGRNVEFPRIESDARCAIKTAKAYSSVSDKSAKWPKSNFTKVTSEELAKKTYDCLVMSAPTVDITNLDTSKLKQSDDTSMYQESILASCKNIFKVAEISLKDNLNLKKVVIMEHTPRYDAKEVDPIELKTALVKYANNVFNQLWLDSSLKQKIAIGSHTIETNSDGALHNDVFKNAQTGKYDGVHHFGKLGRRLYSRSVGSILMKNLSKERQPAKSEDNHSQKNEKERCPEAPKQKRQNQKNEPNVKVNNRFSVFNSNQGNL